MIAMVVLLSPLPAMADGDNKTVYGHELMTEQGAWNSVRRCII